MTMYPDNQTTNHIDNEQDNGPSPADQLKVKASQAIDYAKKNPEQVQNILLGAIFLALTLGD